MTSFNRREATLSSLERLFSQQGTALPELAVFLVDDNSSDGTAEAVAARFPQVQLIHGNGSLFWNGGMRVAFQAAINLGFDAYIWLNDDSKLSPDALVRLAECAEVAATWGRESIVTGSMRSPVTGARTYGGWKKRSSGLHLHFDAVDPDPSHPVSCDTMNGNFTFIPNAVVKTIGNLDHRFTHQIGDLDYGLRARQAGFGVLVAPGFYGECNDNSRERTWRDKKATLGQRWKHLTSPKGAPIQEWLLYTRRHFGWRWPFYAVSPYIKTLLGI